MTQTVACPHCAMVVSIAPEFAGQHLSCPRCTGVFVAPPALTAPLPAQGAPLSLDDCEPADQPAPRKKKKSKESSDPFSFSGPGARSDDGEPDDDYRSTRRRAYNKPQNSGVKVVGIVVGLVIAAGTSFGVKYILSHARTPDVIPDSSWQPVEVPGLLRGRLPGPASSNTLSANDVKFTMKTFSPNSDSMYAIAYSEGELPPDRLKESSDKLLNDTCNGTKEALAKQGGREVSRESIILGSYSGKQLVIDVPDANGKVILRAYLVRGRIVMLMAGGAGMEPGHANVQKLFSSLEIMGEPEPAAPPKKGKPKAEREMGAP